MSRILVTGAAGFIGSNLTDRLLELGCEVLGVDSFTDYYARERKEGNLAGASSDRRFRLVEGDLLDLDLGGLLGDVDGVVHLAAEPGVRTSWGDNFPRYLRRNVEATQRLLESLPRNVERFVFASSSSIYGSVGDGPVGENSPSRPLSPYGLSKLAAEEILGVYARERGVPVTALRYFTVYGPRQRPEMALSRFISAITRGERIEVFGDGEQVREMTYVSDVVDATVSALESPPGGPYNIGGGARATVNELIGHLRNAFDREVEVCYGPAARGDARFTWADLGRARSELKYEPRVSLKEGIRLQVKWALEEDPSLRAVEAG